MKPPAPQEERTFFVTTNCHQRQAIFRDAERARLMLNVLQENRRKGRFLLHEFVVMPDHIHLLLTPASDVSLEKAVQFIKGGFSFRVKKELGFHDEVWQQSFTEHRVKDAVDYEHHRDYIRMNPVRARLAGAPEEYAYSSAASGAELDECPPWLKPHAKNADTRG
jgi:putative transposase